MEENREQWQLLFSSVYEVVEDMFESACTLKIYIRNLKRSWKQRSFTYVFENMQKRKHVYVLKGIADYLKILQKSWIM